MQTQLKFYVLMQRMQHYTFNAQFYLLVTIVTQHSNALDIIYMILKMSM